MSSQIISDIDNLEKKINDKVSSKNNSLAIYDKLENGIFSLQKRNEILTKVSLIYDHFLNNNNQKISTFAETITAGLKEVFNEHYKFTFDVKKSGKHLVCNYMLQTDKHVYPLELSFTQGDAAKQIIGVILRLLIIKIKSKIKLLILDEPFGGLEVHKKELVAVFLQNISREFGIQLVIISHSPRFSQCADNIINVED